ncbi:glutathione transferase [Pseudoalteromonas sp. GCY]|uniref:fosfomycin resistance glutathione transferase n=1 Tax=Pseudoalteromonas sp. GCY TaxID=2003316 RepID=UPI000BFEF8A6|nr:fosfomycin resistance glutathione transferase [Pseudoalteromonas sp. GCY]PHI38276.1 glutathione transferase [Pseudoalteromonas sp. GCY]QQQ65591.1 fosfomycin resistance glutathione transferase [Pseudoalteromonas sp. GCY]
MLSGLNHITISVSDLEASLTFYNDLLGCELWVTWDKGAYLSLGDVWLCLSLGEPSPSSDYSHIAFNIAAEDFSTFSQVVLEKGVGVWQQNCSEGDSLYIFDPDHHKLEIHSGSLQSRLKSLQQQPYSGLTWYKKL